MRLLFSLLEIKRVSIYNWKFGGVGVGLYDSRGADWSFLYVLLGRLQNWFYPVTAWEYSEHLCGRKQRGY